MKAFIDSDVLIDFYQAREGAGLAEAILALSENHKIEGVTSILCISNIAYLFEKFKIVPKKEIPSAMGALSDVLGILSMGESQLKNAVEMDHTDFEDSLEMAAVKDGGCDYIITNNIKDYRISTVPVLTPGEFLKGIGITV